MRSLWHLIRFHDVHAGYYMGVRTKNRWCRTCDARWKVQ